jgi:putative ABC transport system permease protein
LGALTRAIRNISRRKMRALLVVIALGFSMAIMISIPAGIMANQASAQSLAENFNNTITNMQGEINKTSTLIECRNSSVQGNSSGFPSGGPPGEPFGGRVFGLNQQSFLNETIVDQILSINGVSDVVPFLSTPSNATTTDTISGFGGRSFTITRPLYTIDGICLNSSFVNNYSLLPTNITNGRNLQEGDNGVLVMSQNLSTYFAAGVGSKVVIDGESFSIVGIYVQSGQSSFETRTVYMNITDAQRITDNTGNITMVDVYANDTSYVDGIAEAIQAENSDIQVTTYKDRLTQLQNMETTYTETVTNAQATLGQTETVATQEIIIVLVATSLIVFFVMLYTVRERTKEIGTLKAIGFSNWNVMSQFMLEGMLMSAVAGVVGIAIGTVGAPFLSSLLLPSVNPFRSTGSFQGTFRAGGGGVFAASAVTAMPDLQLMLLAVLAAVLLGALGSLYPAWRASRTRPAEAMRYE